jgi:sec-independent protein translocase protein TatC
MAEAKLPFTAHLEELRKRLITCAMGIGVGFAGSYFFAEDLFAFLVKPLVSIMPEGSTLIFTGLPEAFFTYLKLSFFAGIIFASPVVLYQIWCFVAPGLYAHEKRYAYPFATLLTVFFIVGVAFGYFVVFPIAFKFFLGYTTDSIRPLPSIREYLSFTFKLLLAFGVVFELPLFVLFLSRLGIIDATTLRTQRKFAILIIFVAAAILTPPDIISQILMAGPLILLYECSIVVARIFGKKKS